ncbi:MAG: hypothetical protein R3E90_06045 [Marinicella sp.]
MKKYIIDSWEQYAEADKCYGVEVYKPKYLDSDLLIGIVSYFEFLLNAEIDDTNFHDDHLVLKKTTVLIAEYIQGFDPYLAESVHNHNVKIKSLFQRYLLSCRLELIKREEQKHELYVRIVE